MGMTAKDAEKLIRKTIKPNIITVLEEAIHTGLWANEQLKVEGERQERYRKKFEREGITNIAGFYDIEDDANDAFINEIKTKYGSPARNKKLMVLNNGKGYIFYDRAPGQKINYSNKPENEITSQGKIHRYNVDMDKIELDPVDFSRLGLADEQPLPSGYDVLIDWFSRNVIEPAMESKGEQPPIPPATLPSGYDAARDWFSRNIIEPIMTSQSAAPAPQGFEGPIRPQVGPEEAFSATQTPQTPQASQIPDIKALLYSLFTPVNGAQEPAVPPPPPPSGFEGPIRPQIGVEEAWTATEEPGIAPQGEPQFTSVETQPTTLEQLQRLIASGPVEAGSQQVQNYLQLAGDLGLVPTFGNLGTTPQGLPNSLQIKPSRPPNEPTPRTPPEVEGDKWDEFRAGRIALSNLYAQKAELESSMAKELSDELTQLTQRRTLLSQLAADPRSGLDPKMLAASVQGVEGELDALRSSAQQRVTAALGDITAKIYREEGRLDALRPEAEIALRTRSQTSGELQGVHSASEVIYPSGETGRTIFNSLTPTQQNDVRLQTAEWMSIPFDQQIRATTRDQQIADQDFMAFQEKRQGAIDREIYEHVSAMKQTAVKRVGEIPEIQQELTKLQGLGATTGLPKKEIERRAAQVVQVKAMEELDRIATQEQIQRVQTDKRIQTWMVDPAYPETQAVVEALPEGDGSLSTDEFIQQMWTIAQEQVGQGRAEETVARMLQQYDRNWKENYGPTGIGSTVNLWFNSWMGYRDKENLKRQREAEYQRNLQEARNRMGATQEQMMQQRVRHIQQIQGNQ